MASADCETIFIIGNAIYQDYQEDRMVFDKSLAIELFLYRCVCP